MKEAKHAPRASASRTRKPAAPAVRAERDAKPENIDQPIPYVPTPAMHPTQHGSPLPVAPVDWRKLVELTQGLSNWAVREVKRTRDPRVTSLLAGFEALLSVVYRLEEGGDAVVDVGAHEGKHGSDVSARFRIEFIAEKELWTPEERVELYDARVAKEREIFERRIATLNALKRDITSIIATKKKKKKGAA